MTRHYHRNALKTAFVGLQISTSNISLGVQPLDLVKKRYFPSRTHTYLLLWESPCTVANRSPPLTIRHAHSHTLTTVGVTMQLWWHWGTCPPLDFQLFNNNITGHFRAAQTPTFHSTPIALSLFIE